MVASGAMSLSPHTAIPITHKYAGVRPHAPWLRSPMGSWVQLPPAHGYASPRTMKVRGLVQLIVSTSDGRHWTNRAHEGSGQERPLAGGSGMDTGGRRSRGVTNSFHVSVKVSPVGMGLGNGGPVAAV